MASGHVPRLHYKQCNGCFLHFHKMTPTPTKNTYPVVDRRSFASPAQSASQNPLTVLSLHPRHNLKSKVSFKYLMIRFMAIQCGELPSTWIGSSNSLQNAISALWPPLHTQETLPWPCIEYFPSPFIHSHILHLKVLTILNSHRMEFQPVYILPYWNTLGPPQCSSFGSLWSYGLFYSSQIALLGNNVILKDHLSQSPSRTPIWSTSIGLNCLSIWSNHPRTWLPPTNNYPFIWCIRNNLLGLNNNNNNNPR